MSALQLPDVAVTAPAAVAQASHPAAPALDSPAGCNVVMDSSADCTGSAAARNLDCEPPWAAASRRSRTCYRVLPCHRRHRREEAGSTTPWCPVVVVGGVGSFASFAEGSLASSEGRKGLGRVVCCILMFEAVVGCLRGQQRRRLGSSSCVSAGRSR